MGITVTAASRSPERLHSGTSTPVETGREQVHWLIWKLAGYDLAETMAFIDCMVKEVRCGVRKRLVDLLLMVSFLKQVKNYFMSGAEK